MRSRDDPSVSNNRPQQIYIVQDEGKSKTSDLQSFSLHLFQYAQLLYETTSPILLYCVYTRQE
jgi:hypothetical protein